MQIKPFVYLLTLLLALASLASQSTFAGDGVIEINQARAVAGGVTSGDTPGFPITLSTAGSYRLTSNLSAGSSSGILVTSDNVSIDLNGFSLIGEGTCTGTPVTSCTGGASSKGIDALDDSGLILRNGHILGFGDQGVLAGFNSTDARFLIDGVIATENGDDGFKLGANGVIRNSVSSRNGASGIAAKGGTLIENCVIHGNKNFGIFSSGDGAIAIKGNVIRNHSIADAITNISGNLAQIGENLCDDGICP